MMTYLLKKLPLVLALLSFSISANPMRGMDAKAVRDVAHLARAISLVQPWRSEEKYVEYGLAIYKASQRYGIDPAVLIAITQQETSFRDSLPEGRAGELGICQVLKGWAKNPEFIKEFGQVSRSDFMKPAKSFLFAAWILKNLQVSNRQGTLPYWSFYNARRFEQRFKYFVRVSKFFAKLRKHQHEFRDVNIAFLGAPALRPSRTLAAVATAAPLKTKPQARVATTRKSLLNPYVANASVVSIREAFFGTRPVVD